MTTGWLPTPGIGTEEIPDQYGSRAIGLRGIPEWWLDVTGDINIVDPGYVNGYTYRINGIPVLMDSSKTIAGGIPYYDDNGEPQMSPGLIWNDATQTLEVSNIAVAGNGTIEGNLYVNGDRKSTRLNSSHLKLSRMPSSA